MFGSDADTYLFGLVYTMLVRNSFTILSIPGSIMNI